MDFGAILDKWEKQGVGNNTHAKAVDVEGSAFPDREKSLARRSRLLRKKPDAYFDLHGFTQGEAWAGLDQFFEDSFRKGLEKIQVIHGKGNHSHNEAALRELCRRFIEKCTYAGECGYCSAREGGTGATWVILKKTNVPGSDSSRRN